MKQTINCFGFTLIELMIVIGMIALMAGGSIAAYTRFNTDQQISNDARQLVAELIKARTMAATLQYPPDCSGLTGINVRSAVIDSLSDGIQTTSLCSSGNVAGQEIKILKTSVFNESFDITFLPSSGYLSTGTDKIIIIRDQNNPSITKSITVGAYNDVSAD